MRYDLAAVGELLIDFTPAGTDDQGSVRYARNAGGAPANVLCMAAKLGLKTAFIGKVGADSFGDFLEQTLIGQGIDTQGLVKDAQAFTTLAFVTLSGSERSFDFCRKPGADMLLRAEELNCDVLSQAKFVHFGSVSLSETPGSLATLQAVHLAKQHGACISFDPNYRPFLWPDRELAKKAILNAAALSDVIKLSEEELELVTGFGTDALEQGAQALLDLGASLVLVTLGANGSAAFTKKVQARAAGFAVKAVDTTGAGDSFTGAVLSRLAALSLDEIRNLDETALLNLLVFANACGALTVTKFGAIPALPQLKDIEALLQDTK